MAAVFRLRQKVLIDTLTTLYDEKERDRLREKALANIKRWESEITPKDGEDLVMKIEVVSDDWGVATQNASRQYGKVFACLNMANQFVFGGAYLAGAPAQEENMFRRTDCHFTHVKNLEMSRRHPVEKAKLSDIYYDEEEFDLIDGLKGKVYYDTTPRICIKGPENPKMRTTLGYEKLAEDDMFPFFELRSAALDLRERKFAILPRDEKQNLMRSKIQAQLKTLIDNNQRHVVLGAFGCGAFLNDAKNVANRYKEELEKVKESFDVVIFAIFYPGYGPDNFTPFKKVFEPSEELEKTI